LQSWSGSLSGIVKRWPELCHKPLDYLDAAEELPHRIVGAHTAGSPKG
jgi:hypothetical protein